MSMAMRIGSPLLEVRLENCKDGMGLKLLAADEAKALAVRSKLFSVCLLVPASQAGFIAVSSGGNCRLKSAYNKAVHQKSLW